MKRALKKDDQNRWPQKTITDEFACSYKNNQLKSFLERNLHPVNSNQTFSILFSLSFSLVTRISESFTG